MKPLHWLRQPTTLQGLSLIIAGLAGAVTGGIDANLASTLLIAAVPPAPSRQQHGPHCGFCCHSSGCRSVGKERCDRKGTAQARLTEPGFFIPHRKGNHHV